MNASDHSGIEARSNFQNAPLEGSLPMARDALAAAMTTRSADSHSASAKALAMFSSSSVKCCFAQWVK